MRTRGGASIGAENGGDLGVSACPPPCRPYWPCCPCACAVCGPTTLPPGFSRRPQGSGLAPVIIMNCWVCIPMPVRKKLSELFSSSAKSREQSRRSYDNQLCSASPPKSPGTTAYPKSARQTHSSSWAPPNEQYWAQFHGVRPQGPESRQRQQKHNQQVLGYCLLLMLAGMGLHYIAFRKLEQMHRSFMDEKDRIITAIYNDTRARARANRAMLQQERHRRLQPPAPRASSGSGLMPPGTGP
ncbi:dnaJ homolog subfamily C member 4 isoform X3 [Fukomys damarensis]|uniref:dnaJ homolog subfamily C member 4 isoform X3 n=1 Tax=Fukomys damarensis TaxID=885580 RepID=UPI0008FF69EA|nr:dnaJ homolog subfamily C member 4 isoform X3 [Fukomys damarensis]